MTTLLTRTALIYILLLITMRVLGKRQLGELQASELVITFMLSELAVSPIHNESISLTFAIAPVLLLTTLEMLVSRLLIKCNPLKRLLCEKPSILIRNGVIDQKELKRQRIGITELLSELRQKDVGDPQDVAYAILEENGKLSVFVKPQKRPLTAEEVEVTTIDGGIAHPVVIDGIKSRVNMTLAEVSDKDVARELKRRHLTLDRVLLMTVNDKKEFHAVKKDDG